MKRSDDSFVALNPSELDEACGGWSDSGALWGAGIGGTLGFFGVGSWTFGVGAIPGAAVFGTAGYYLGGYLGGSSSESPSADAGMQAEPFAGDPDMG